MSRGPAKGLETISWVAGGGLVLGAFLFLAFSGHRSLALALAVVALVAARYLYVTLPSRLDRADNPPDTTGIDPAESTTQDRE